MQDGLYLHLLKIKDGWFVVSEEIINIMKFVHHLANLHHLEET